MFRPCTVNCAGTREVRREVFPAKVIMFVLATVGVVLFVKFTYLTDFRFPYGAVQGGESREGYRVRFTNCQAAGGRRRQRVR